jgi:uracil-DNA glycosylase
MNEVLYNRLGETWFTVLGMNLYSNSFNQLGNFLAEERRYKIIYPEPEEYFKAFKLTPFNKVKVVILGQDPYPNGEADGLAFSVKEDSNVIKIPPSLKAIFEEIEQDVYGGFRVEQDWNLERWAEQGVLLLNTVLTVEKRKPKSHSWKGWEEFTKIVVKKLSEDYTNRKVFLLWGNDAKAYSNIIDEGTHLVLKSGHPATKYYDNDMWTGNKHFSQTNAFLREQKKGTILW